MDLYISNMFSSAGGRITYQPEFKEEASESAPTRLQQFARGNTLLLNDPRPMILPNDRLKMSASTQE